jgi:hypothetical protein
MDLGTMRRTTKQELGILEGTMHLPLLLHLPPVVALPRLSAVKVTLKMTMRMKIQMTQA